MSDRPSRRRWARRIMFGFSGLLLVMLAAGAIYQHLAQRADLAKYPPSGEMIDVGGFRIHMSCTGTGEPTVIVEAAGGDYSLSWARVQRAVSNETRICVYDRAGMGWSEYDHEKPNSPRVVRNLALALKKAGVAGPFLMVGESIGGVYVREFARQYPSDVAGMVLVDSSHEQQYAYLPEEIDAAARQSSDQELRMYRICSIVAPFGLVRLLGLADKRVGPGAPSQIRGMMVAAMNRTHYCAATRDYIVAVWEDADQEKGPPSLGDIPLIVLTAGREAPQPGVSDAANQRLFETSSRLQSELATLSTDSSHRIVEDAGHIIHFDRPDAVQDAILDVVEKAGQRLE